MDDHARQELERARESFQKKLERAQAKVAECEAAIVGIDAAIKLGGGKPAGSQPKSEVVEAIESIVGGMVGAEFTVHDVKAALHDAYPELKNNTITAALKRLEGREIIREVARGRGRRPTTYCVSEVRAFPI